MGQERVVVTDMGYERFELARAVLEPAGFAFDVFPGDARAFKADVNYAKDAAGLIVRRLTVDEALLDALPSVRAVVRFGVGYDNVDIPAATARGVKVANVQGYGNGSVSDHALMLALALARALPLGMKLFHKTYCNPPQDRVFELGHATLGIVGLGRIGGTLCRKAQGLFKRVLACDPYIAAERFGELGAVQADLATLLRESDVISLHCNLTDETRHLIGDAEFEKMERTPALINTARGEVVDEAALMRALNGDRLHGAGIDVFCEEPPGERYEEFLNHPKAIGTGHYAWYSESAAEELERRAAENLRDLLQGKIPEDCLNP